MCLLRIFVNSEGTDIFFETSDVTMEVGVIASRQR